MTLTIDCNIHRYAGKFGDVITQNEFCDATGLDPCGGGLITDCCVEAVNQNLTMTLSSSCACWDGVTGDFTYNGSDCNGGDSWAHVGGFECAASAGEDPVTLTIEKMCCDGITQGFLLFWTLFDVTQGFCQQTLVSTSPTSLVCNPFEVVFDLTFNAPCCNPNAGANFTTTATFTE